MNADVGSNLERYSLGLVSVAPRPGGGDLALTRGRGCASCARAGGDEDLTPVGALIGVGDSADPSKAAGERALYGVAVAMLLGLVALAGYGAYELGAHHLAGAAGGRVAGGLVGLGAYGGALVVAEYVGPVASVTGLASLGLAGYGAWEIAGVPGVIGAGVGLVATVAMVAG